MIRDATAQDIPACLEMGAKFHAESGVGEFIPFDYSSFLATLTLLIKSNGLLVMDGGMAGVFIAPAFYNTNVLLASEVFWWVEPEYRGEGLRLMTALENRSRELGAAVLQMSSLEKLKSMDKFYERRGYKPVDHLYYKVL